MHRSFPNTSQCLHIPGLWNICGKSVVFLNKEHGCTERALFIFIIAQHFGKLNISMISNMCQNTQHSCIHAVCSDAPGPDHPKPPRHQRSTDDPSQLPRVGVHLMGSISIIPPRSHGLLTALVSFIIYTEIQPVPPIQSRHIILFSQLGRRWVVSLAASLKPELPPPPLQHTIFPPILIFHFWRKKNPNSMMTGDLELACWFELNARSAIPWWSRHELRYAGSPPTAPPASSCPARGGASLTNFPEPTVQFRRNSPIWSETRNDSQIGNSSEISKFILKVLDVSDSK